MKRTALLSIYLIGMAVSVLAQSPLQVDREQIQARAGDGVYEFTIPITNTEADEQVTDLTVSLLDSEYNTLAQARKKLFLLNGQQIETVALPVTPNTPPLEACIVRIDLNQQIWLKRFQAKKPQQELHILGQDQWIAGSPASLRVLVSQSPGGEPIEGAEITITTQHEGDTLTLAETRTDASGSASPQFQVPESLTGTAQLTVQAKSPTGQDQLRAEVQVKTGVKILLTTDKPVYQPGQLMRIRALAAHRASGEPLAEKAITLEVYDGKGNKVFKKNQTASEFGIAWADFQLADEVNQGNYKIKASLGNDQDSSAGASPSQTSEKTVRVFEYVLPKFGITVKNAKKYYAPGDTVSGELQAKYFFGKPLQNARVEIIANAFDVGFNEFAKVKGQTDEQGHYEYEIEIPERLVGQPMFEGNTIVQLDIHVTDTAEHEEQKIHTFHVATKPVQIDMIAESGSLLTGVENEIYVATSRPDGTPVQAKLEIHPERGESQFVQTDDNGVASFFITPAVEDTAFAFKVRSELDGETTQHEVELPVNTDENQILLRPDRGVYRVGGTMNLTVLSNQSDRMPVFLDVIKNDQTVATHTLRLEQGQAQFSLPLDNTLNGTLALNAYIIRRDGNMVRDTRQVVVLRSDDLQIEINPDQDQYRPGQPAVLRIAVHGQNNQPVRAALGMHIVDESVYSLSEKQPGLAKIFFAIEEELLTPKYEIHGMGFDEVIPITAREYEKNANASRALLAKLDAHSSYALNLNSHQEMIERANRDLGAITQNLSINVPEGPHRLDELLLRFDQDPREFPTLDPWGTPYFVEDEGRTTALISAGPDAELGSGDDIRVKHERVERRLYHAQFFERGEAGGDFRMDAFGGNDMAEGLPQVNILDVRKTQPMQVDAPRPQQAMADGGVNRPIVIEEGQYQVRMESPPHVMPSVGEDVQREVNYFQDTALEKLAKADTTGPVVVGGQLNEEALKQAIGEQIDLDLLSDEQLRELTEAAKALQDEKPQANDQTVRVRRYFPETLYYTPQLITDNQGRAQFEIHMADSITTWRINALANAKSGALGEATGALQVFKRFFIDLDLPIALLQNDEVTIPVAVHNYLDQAQEVRVELEQAGWFELLEGELGKTVQVGPEEVTSVTYRIAARELGDQPITVYAWGTQSSDAMGKTIEVRPNGKPMYNNHNGRLSSIHQETVRYPQNRIAGADQLFVKIYPGVFSQVVEGLDAIYRMPYGCFEQTSSTTYPNILALNYMRETGRITPEIEMKALEYINLGYQRLLTFEIAGGGFDVFGNPPAQRVLSAYGLMEFSDMNEVYDVDPKVIERTKNWLLSQMQDDGTWQPDENYAHAEMWKSIQDNDLLVTAYIALALAEAGADPQLAKSKQYLLNHAQEAGDAYTLAILSNALLALAPEHPTTQNAVDRLVQQGQINGDLMHWESEASMSFARGQHAWVETTAWAVLALIQDGRYHTEPGKAVTWLIEAKDPNGTWGTTHGTVLALKALLATLGSRSEATQATITVTVNGELAETLEITPENTDVFHQLNVSKYAEAGENQVQLQMDGEGQLLYQVVSKYFVPWPNPEAGGDVFAIAVEYDRTELRRNDLVTARVTARNKKAARLEMVMIDIGIPPGFRVEQSALEDYVKQGTIAKYTVMSRQLLIYLESMPGGQELELAVPMRATLPMLAKAPESTIYEYYNPENRDTAEPQELEVK